MRIRDWSADGCASELTGKQHDRKTETRASKPAAAFDARRPVEPPPPTPHRPDPRRTRHAGTGRQAGRQMGTDAAGQEGAGGELEPAECGRVFCLMPKAQMGSRTVDKLQGRLREEVFHYAADSKKAAGRALGTIVELSSDERRVGKECVSTGRSGWSPYP